MMRALALTGPRVYKKELQAFQTVAGDCAAELRLLRMPDAITVSSAIASFSPELILILGGDGTLHRHLPALFAADLPVLVVPLGSGNDFAKSSGISTTRHALELFKDFIVGNTTVIWRADLGVVVATAADGMSNPKADGMSISTRVASCCFA